MTAPYVWQEAQWQRLMSARQQDRFPHALLLNGSVGLGISQFAHDLVNLLLCEQPVNNSNACGQCKSCQLYTAGTHPDFIKLQPEEEGKAIKIDAVRALSAFLELKSQFGRRLAIIEPAEAMNRNAANSLLKTLEEPPENAVILLINPVYMQLPITIRSRCQRIIFPAPDNETGTQWLQDQGVEVEKNKMLLHLYGNAPLDALRAIEAEDGSKLDKVITDLHRVMQRKADPVSIAESWKGYSAQRLLEWLHHILQDLARDRFNTSPSLQSEIMRGMLQESRNRLDLRQLYYLLDKLHEYKRILNSGISINIEALFEEFLICWLTRHG